MKIMNNDKLRMVHKIIVYYFNLNLDAISNAKLDMIGKKV